MDTALAAAACGDSYSSVSVLKRLLISDATYLIGVIIGRPFNWQNFSWPLLCSIDKIFESEGLTALFWIDIFFKSMALCKKFLTYCCFNDLKLIGDSLNYSHLLPRHEENTQAARLPMTKPPDYKNSTHSFSSEMDCIAISKSKVVG